MKNTLEKRIILFSFIILFLTILANTGMDIAAYRRDYKKALIFSSQSLGASLKGNIEKVIGLGIDIKDIPGITEKCREVVGANPPAGDYCVITDMEGKTLFLSDPFFNSLPFNHIVESLTLNAQKQVRLIGVDRRYYDTVTPIKSPDGKHLALIHIGFPENEVSNKIEKMILRSIFILLFFFLVAFTLVVVFVKKSIMQPISSLLNGVKKISEGAFDTRIEEVPVYEFNELAKNINFMSESLKFREEEVQKSYRDLEGAHNKLHSSYLKLESLSLELERSEELYKSLMEDSGDAIVVIGDDEIVKMVNKLAEEFFGYAAQEMVGLPLTKLLLLLDVENIPRMHKMFKDALNGLHIAEEMQFVKKDGESVLGRVNVSSIKSGSERLVQAIFRDITKEREILNNLGKSAADLARLNKMKDSFLGLASHELKTPLTVIMGYAELILTDMDDKVDKTVLEMVENIANAAARLDNIIKDMVDVSMIDEKRLQLKLDDVNLNHIVESTVNELRFFFSMRKQGLVLQLDESIPTIRGDSLRLMQLLSNVLGNAIKFTPDGGCITVSTSAKYLLRSKQSDDSDHMKPVVNIGKEHHLYVEVTVKDTGIGIDREDQLRIFEKFYEAGKIEEHSSGKVAFKAKGAGLGLAIAKGIVEMHGGEIWVESPGYNPSQYPGSTFHILLPLNPLIGDASLDYMNLLR
ncbi:MAG: hypothetical protein FD174_60 [Geobacteraceae bacterium]|nr:MAG: hypothetical protein FD174_60 [Geobacteraceae bacterium]